MPAKRGKIVSEAEFRRMWADLTISQNEIGRRLGISGEAVRFRAAARNLPPRPKERRFAQVIDAERAARLYRSGLSEDAVAAVMGTKRPTVQGALNRLGVKRRGRHDKASISPDEVTLRLMAASARETLGHMACAEMLDDPRRVMRRAA